jgi:hypothetical protein
MQRLGRLLPVNEVGVGQLDAVADVLAVQPITNMAVER